jgi:hypothetical protein
MSASWLENVKVGDVVAAYSGYSRDDIFLKKVERLTTTQIVTEGGDRYRRADGDRVGQGTTYFRAGIMEATPEVHRKVARRGMLRRLQGVGWGTVPDEVLRAVLAAYDAGLKRAKQNSPAGTGA